jgi:hypothetical protein
MGLRACCLLQSRWLAQSEIAMDISQFSYEFLIILQGTNKKIPDAGWCLSLTCNCYLLGTQYGRASCNVTTGHGQSKDCHCSYHRIHHLVQESNMLINLVLVHRSNMHVMDDYYSNKITFICILLFGNLENQFVFFFCSSKHTKWHQLQFTYVCMWELAWFLSERWESSSVSTVKCCAMIWRWDASQLSACRSIWYMPQWYFIHEV